MSNPISLFYILDCQSRYDLRSFVTHGTAICRKVHPSSLLSCSRVGIRTPGCPPTNSQIDFTNGLNKLVGSTILRNRKQLYSRLQYYNDVYSDTYPSFLILFTDATFSRPERVAEQIQNLREKGCSIIVITPDEITDASKMERLNQICSSYIPEKDFCAGDIIPIGQVIEPKAFVRISRESEPCSITDDVFDLSVSVTMTGNDVIPQGSIFNFGGAGYFQVYTHYMEEDLLPNRSISFRIELQKLFRNYIDIPTSIPVCLQVDRGNGIIEDFPCTVSGEIQAHWFCRDLCTYSPPTGTYGSVAMFGFPGNGKSTSINFILSSLLPKLKRIAYAAQSTSHVTKKLQDSSLLRLVLNLLTW